MSRRQFQTNTHLLDSSFQNSKTRLAAYSIHLRYRLTPHLHHLNRNLRPENRYLSYKFQHHHYSNYLKAMPANHRYHHSGVYKNN
jgi:hypothetical protein